MGLTVPTQTPTWATDNVNNTEPSAAKKALGWVNGEEPASAYENWQMNLNGDWWAWIDQRFGDGDNTDDVAIFNPAVPAEALVKVDDARLQYLSAGEVVEFEVAVGRVTAGRSLTDGISFDGVGDDKSIYLDAVASNDKLTYKVSTNLWSFHCGAATAVVEIGPALVTVKELAVFEEDVTVTDVLITDQRTKNYGPVGWRGESGGVAELITTSGVHFQNLTAADNSWLGIDLDKGDRIKGFSCYCQQLAAGTLTAALYSVSSTGVVTAVGSGSASTTDVSTWGNRLVTGLTETLVEGTSYVLRVESTGTGAVEISNTSIYYDRPVST